MRIVVVSDTHLPRFGRALPRVLVAALEQADRILHLGDFTEPEIPGWFEAFAPLEAVAGNNDPDAIVERFGRRRIVDVAGARLGLIHGDGTRGTTLSRALEAFADDPVDLVAFGHSHVPLLERHADRWVLNPGSPTDKRRQPRYSFAILTIADAQIRPDLIYFADKQP